MASSYRTTPSEKRSLRGIVAHAEELLRRDVRRRTHRADHLLGDEVGELGVAREPEVEEHRDPVVADDHVLGLHVEVEDALGVHVLERLGDRRAEPADLVRRDWGARRPGLERPAAHLLHDEVRELGEVAGRDEPRDVRSRERRQDRALRLVGDERARRILRGEARAAS